MKRYIRDVFGGHLMVSAALIASIILVGAVAYMQLESLSFTDALYHSVISVTTVGYEDLATKDSTKIFTMGLVLAGLAAFYYFAGAIVETLISGRLFEVFKLSKREEDISRIRDHVILCGYGDVGSLVAGQVKGIVVVERNPDRFGDLLNKGFLAVSGDSTNPDALKSAGIDRAKAMIIALDSDPEVVYTILTAKELKPDIRIYARANETNSVNKMRKAGADYVICLPEIGSRDLVNALEGREGCIGVDGKKAGGN